MNVLSNYLGVTPRKENQDRTTRDSLSRMATALNPGWRGVPKRRSVAWTWTPFGGSDSGVTVQAGYWEKSRKARKGSVSDARRMAASFSGL